jgi:hypothetical protein
LVTGAVGAGVVDAVTGGAVVVGAVVVGAVVVGAVVEAEVSAAVAGCDAGVVGCDAGVVGFGVWEAWTGDEDPLLRAATVPPTPPRTARIATPATQIRCLMDEMLRPPYQLRTNGAATSSESFVPPSVHSSPRHR